MPDTSCALCAATDSLAPYDVPASPEPVSITACAVCSGQMERGDLDTGHWQCLTTSMWSETPAVQVTAYRMLKRLSAQSWAQDALDMLYLDEETLAWAEAGIVEVNSESTRDSNGTVLQNGDNVTLIKDLPVKGAGFTAKRGTAVRGITLTDNPEHIEGRVNGQRIVLVSAFLKKS